MKAPPDTRCCRKCRGVEGQLHEDGSVSNTDSCFHPDCLCHSPKPPQVEKEFPLGKEAYCPRCYFEDEKTILREDCPHSKPQPASWSERLRAEWPDMEREINAFFKHKCNHELMTRPRVARDYGIPALESFIAKEIEAAEARGADKERKRINNMMPELMREERERVVDYFDMTLSADMPYTQKDLELFFKEARQRGEGI